MLQLEKGKKGFRLFLSHLLLVEHTNLKPFLTLGQGEGSYRMRHGSFSISQQLHKRVPLFYYEVQREEPQEIYLQLEGIGVRFKLQEELFSMDLLSVPSSYNRCFINLKAGRGEHIYGCGEQYSRLDLKGSRLPLWCEEQGVGRGKDLITFLAQLTKGAGGSWYTTYFPQPTFLSTRGFFCHVEASCYMVFDFRHQQHHLLEIWGIPSLYFALGEMEELLKKLTTFLGRQPPLPSWALDGVWLGIQGGKEVVKEKVKAAKDEGVPVAAVWAQDWQGIRMTSFGKQLLWDWSYDKDLYPKLPLFIRELLQEGIRFLGYINPFLALEGRLYKRAAQEGYLVKNKDQKDYQITITTFPAVMLDLSNPGAVNWIKGIIKENLLGIGLSGWMADFGEYLPTDALLFSQGDPTTFHNQYPVLWAKANWEAVVEARKEKEVVFFSRSGYTGISRYTPLIWGGDQLVNWSMNDGLASVIPASLSLSFSGLGHFHSDLGGYTTVAWIKRKKELFMRWAELAAFTPVMRSHEGNRPQSNWQFDSDQETLKHLARMGQIHLHLKPYLLSLLEDYQRLGLPLIRHPLLHYKGDEVLYSLCYQYLLGADLLVAPVYHRWRKGQKVYLPGEGWIHLFSGRVFKGGWHVVEAPLGVPPVFYRSSSPFQDLFLQVRKRWGRG